MAVPVGPIGILCIRRSLANGQLSGVFSGLGAATADAVYGILAAFGITFAAAFLEQQKLLIQFVGAVFLLYLGTKIFFESQPALGSTKTPKKSLLSDYFSAFLLTLANPLTILSFAAVFASVGLTQACGSYLSAGLLVTGIFIGSASWWFTLSSSVGFLHKKISIKTIRTINKISGIIITSFGIIIFGSVIMRFFK